MAPTTRDSVQTKQWITKHILTKHILLESGAQASLEAETSFKIFLAGREEIFIGLSCFQKRKNLELRGNKSIITSIL